MQLDPRVRVLARETHLPVTQPTIRLTNQSLPKPHNPPSHHLHRHLSSSSLHFDPPLPHVPLVREASHLIIIFIIILLPLHSLHLDLPLYIPLAIPRRNFILATIPQILKRQLLRTSQALNISDPFQRRIQELLEAGLGANFVEGALHGHAVGTHHGARVDGEYG